jgi:hypothetical protein
MTRQRLMMALICPSLRSSIERDGTPAEFADLPVGWRAWRKSPDSPWLRKRSVQPLAIAGEPLAKPRPID